MVCVDEWSQQHMKPLLHCSTSIVEIIADALTFTYKNITHHNHVFFRAVVPVAVLYFKMYEDIC